MTSTRPAGPRRLTDAAIGTDTEAMERYRSLFEDLACARGRTGRRHNGQRGQGKALLATREELAPNWPGSKNSSGNASPRRSADGPHWPRPPLKPQPHREGPAAVGEEAVPRACLPTAPAR
ncbi:MAG: hypothetical protein R2710_29765 [Acidimicrobiales bacterium]